ncbi:MAG: hypothetical protein HQK91_07795 [Nitrospirae bacterium]|nr:hypothetical protein [Nitrospirota bacterium]
MDWQTQVITVDKRKVMTGHKSIQANEIYTHGSGIETITAYASIVIFKSKKF